jgi:uncharacterized protein (DUF2384 family)
MTCPPEFRKYEVSEPDKSPFMTSKNSNSSRAPRATLAQRAIAAAVIKLRDRQAAMLEDLKTLDPEVAKLAIEALGTATGAAAWLMKPALGLDGKIPVKVLRTRGGRKQVMQLLVRIDYNVLS